MSFAVPIENAAKAVEKIRSEKDLVMSGAHQGLEHLLYEVKKVVVGQDHFLERVLVALLAGGHLLVEGVPGLAKTLTVSTLAKVMQGSFKRIQFTPDLVPADLTGTRIFNQKSGEFATLLGPVFANLVLADEINRAPAKVQSALLEVMQERQVTIAGESYPVPRPFVVMATQNPIEIEGTYALPEAQVDRFMMKILIGYPSEEEEFVIVQRVTGDAMPVGPVTSTDALLEMQAAVRKLYVDPSLMIYAVKLVAATRAPEKCGLPDYQRFIQYGASPRASIAMIEAGRALAYIRGRDYVLPADVVDVAADVLRHRLVPSYEALVGGPDARTRSSARSCAPCRPRFWIPPVPQVPDHILRRLELPVVRRLEGLLQGDYRSPSRGDGLDLADLREYQFHDDVRRIDWNATARLDTPYVREYLEDREIPVWFLLDMSPSMMFEGVSISKHAVLMEFAVLMCRLMLGRGNRTGAMMFSSGVDRAIPARGGRQQLLQILSTVAEHRAQARRHRPQAGAEGGRACDPAPLAGLCGLRFHQRSGLGAGA